MKQRCQNFNQQIKMFKMDCQKYFTKLQIVKKCIFIVKSVKNTQVIHFHKKKVLISKNKIKGKSRCAIWLTKRTFIDEIEGDLEIGLEIYLQFFTDWCYKHEDLLC